LTFAGRTADALPSLGAQLEQRLPVPLAELVEDRPPRRIGERPIRVAHGPTIGK
jgi:hypothetical protein